MSISQSLNESVSIEGWIKPRHDFLTAFRRHVVASSVIVVVVLLLALTALLLSKKEYRADVIVSLENARLQSLPNQLSIAPTTVDLFAVKAAVETVSSPTVADRALDTLQLWDDPELNAVSLPSRIIHAGIKAVADLLEDVPVLGDALRDGDITESSSHRFQIRERFQRRVLVSQTPQSLLLSIAYLSSDPVKAALVANTLANIYVDLSRMGKINEVNFAIKQLQETTALFHDRMIEAQTRLKAYRDKLGIVELGNATQMTASTQNTFDLQAQYLAARADRVEREKALEELQVRAAGYEAGDGIGGFASPIIQQLELQRVALLQKRAQVVASYGANYPIAQRLSALIADIDKSIRSALDSFLKTTEENVRIARTKEDALSQELKASKVQDQLESPASTQLVDLEAQAQSARTMFESSQANLGRATEALSMQWPDARVVSPATAPLRPAYPRPIVFLGAGLVIGAAFAAAFVYLREASNRRLLNIAGLETASQARLVGLLPRLEKRQDSLTSAAFQTAVDTMRLHITSGIVGTAEKRGCVLLVTSSVTGEGKTAVSLALAKAGAEGGERVLLIEGDTRKGPSDGGVTKGQGLSAIMDGTVDPTTMTTVERRPGLFVLSSGEAWNRAIGPTEYRRLQSLITSAAANFDLIVIDSPPVLSTPDSPIYATLVDRILFLVQWGTTPMAAAGRALHGLSRHRPGISAICVTQVGTRDVKHLLKAEPYSFAGYGGASQQLGMT